MEHKPQRKQSWQYQNTQKETLAGPSILGLLVTQILMFMQIIKMIVKFLPKPIPQCDKLEAA